MIDKNNWFYKTAIRLWPAVADMEGVQQIEAVTIFIPLLTLLPFAVIGLGWLAFITDVQRLSDNILAFAIGLFTLFFLQNQTFTLRVKFSEDDELGLTSSLAGLVIWSAALIVGPSALWMIVLSSGIEAIWNGWKHSRHDLNPVWAPLSMFIQVMSGRVFAMLIALALYVQLGGLFPLEDVSVAAWGPVIVATIVSAVIPGILLLPTAVGYNQLIKKPSTFRQLSRFFAGAVALTLIMSPFALLAALIFLSGRTAALVVFIAGIFLVNAMAHYLSVARDRNRRRAREFEELGNLGEEFLKAPSDPNLLGEILDAHLLKIFPEDHIEVRLFELENEHLWRPVALRHPQRHKPIAEDVWKELCSSRNAYLTMPKVVLPGHKAPYGDAVAVKIQAVRPGDSVDESVCLGGIYLLRNVEIGKISEALDSVQSLASQISSAIYRLEIYAESMARSKMEQELEFAGHIQNSFLPTAIPEIDGWQVAAVLESARQTSGDFYDFVPLDNNHLGILVADVSDKGTGAALYMALSRTLIRTYAMDHPNQPDVAFALANERIMADTHTEQFVTAFYGVLDINSGVLTYANAGHNPPYLVRSTNGQGKGSDSDPGEGRDTGSAEGSEIGSEAEQKMLSVNGRKIEALMRTGIPLGMFEGMKWVNGKTHLNSGDILLMYTDGVTEAQNDEQELFDDDRLIAIGTAHLGQPAGEVKEAIVNSIHDFVGDAPQFDDITLVVLSRDSST